MQQGGMNQYGQPQKWGIQQQPAAAKQQCWLFPESNLSTGFLSNLFLLLTPKSNYLTIWGGGGGGQQQPAISKATMLAFSRKQFAHSAFTRTSLLVVALIHLVLTR